MLPHRAGRIFQPVGAEEQTSMSKIAVIPILFSLACATNASAALIATMECQAGISPCNSESNVESLLGQDVELVWESAGAIVPGQVSILDDSNSAIADPFASDLQAASQLFGGDGFSLFASFASFNFLNLYDGSSWYFPDGISGIKIWRRPCSAVPEPSSALVFALGFGMLNARIRKRARRK